MRNREVLEFWLSPEERADSIVEATERHRIARLRKQPDHVIGEPHYADSMGVFGERTLCKWARVDYHEFCEGPDNGTDRMINGLRYDAKCSKHEMPNVIRPEEQPLKECDIIVQFSAYDFGEGHGVCVAAIGWCYYVDFLTKHILDDWPKGHMNRIYRTHWLRLARDLEF